MPYEDDETIEDVDYLLRRVPITPSHIILDKNLNRRRPTSAAFENHPNGSPMSVCIEKDLFDLGEDYQKVIQNRHDHIEFALARFTAGLARSVNQIIAREEVEGELAHGVVVGNKTHSVRSKLAKGCEWAIPPDDEDAME